MKKLHFLLIASLLPVSLVLFFHQSGENRNNSLSKTHVEISKVYIEASDVIKDTYGHERARSERVIPQSNYVVFLKCNTPQNARTAIDVLFSTTPAFRLDDGSALNAIRAVSGQVNGFYRGYTGLSPPSLFDPRA